MIKSALDTSDKFWHSQFSKFYIFQYKLECAASNGNRYPPYPQVMATAISQ